MPKKGAFSMFFVFICLLFFYFRPVLASDLNSPRFHLKLDNISSQKQIIPKKESITSNVIKQLDIDAFETDGYVIKTNINKIKDAFFTFTISNSNSDFGEFNISTPQYTNTSLSVMPPANNFKFQITAYQENDFKTLAGNIFLNTNCNGGIDTCSKSLAKAWTSNSAYGFGYNLSINNILPDFANNTFFRPFPKKVNKDNEVLFFSNQIQNTTQTTVIYKINVPPSQPKGVYRTNIIFTALPLY